MRTFQRLRTKLKMREKRGVLSLKVVKEDYQIIPDFHWRFCRAMCIMPHKCKHREPTGSCRSLSLGYNTFLYLQDSLPPTTGEANGEPLGGNNSDTVFWSRPARVDHFTRYTYCPLWTRYLSIEKGVAIAYNTCLLPALARILLWYWGNTPPLPLRTLRQVYHL